MARSDWTRSNGWKLEQPVGEVGGLVKDTVLKFSETGGVLTINVSGTQWASCVFVTDTLAAGTIQHRLFFIVHDTAGKKLLCTILAAPKPGPGPDDAGSWTAVEGGSLTPGKRVARKPGEREGRNGPH